MSVEIIEGTAAGDGWCISCGHYVDTPTTRIRTKFDGHSSVCADCLADPVKVARLENDLWVMPWNVTDEHRARWAEMDAAYRSRRDAVLGLGHR